MEVLVNGNRIKLLAGTCVILGRGEATGITLRNVSRKQVGLTLAEDGKEVKLEVVGPNNALVGGTNAPSGSVHTLQLGDFFSLLASHADEMLCQIVPSDETSDTSASAVMDVDAPTVDVAPEKADGADHAAVKDITMAEAGVEAGEAESPGRKRKASEPAEGGVAVPKIRIEGEEEEAKELEDDLGLNQWVESKCVIELKTKGFVHTRRAALICIDGGLLVHRRTGRSKTFVDDGNLELVCPEAKRRIEKLPSKGYEVVLVSGDTHLCSSEDTLKAQMDVVASLLSCPVRVLCAKIGSRLAALPRTVLATHCAQRRPKSAVSLDLSSSLVVGANAGRLDGWSPGAKKDRSSLDRKFAMNIGADFFTPQEAFLKADPAPYEYGCFDPFSMLGGDTPLCDPSSASLTLSGVQELIVCVGPPAAGKSTLVEKHLVPAGYVRINRDTLGTWQKCVAACKQALEGGESVVVDNTNPSVADRARYLKLALDQNIFCRCFHFVTSVDQARHNNTVGTFPLYIADIHQFRTLIGGKSIPVIAMNLFRKQFAEPSTTEGFNELVKINFVPEFESVTLERFYSQFFS